MMRLGLWYVPGTEEDIEHACLLASSVLSGANVAPEEGYAALVRASSGDGVADDANIIVAWYEAEAAALVHIYKATGIWPEDGALIVL